MRIILKRLLPCFALIPLLVGTIGYYISGEPFTDCLYAAFALYFTNPVSDAYNWFVEFARWTAPLVTASAILCVLKNVWNNLVWRMIGFSKDSIAVYTDCDQRICFGEGSKAIYPGDSFKGYCKTQIILFSSDNKNLRFYEENKDKLENKSVYLGLRELEQGLVQNLDKVMLFDVNRSIARIFWKQVGLWRWNKNEISLVIYGNGSLSHQILSTGLQMNLFSKNQRICYHLVTDNPSFELRHPSLELMNDDQVMYHSVDSLEAWESIRQAELVIVADELESDLFQNIVVNTRGDVYYYSPEKGDVGELLDFGKIIPFGRNEEVFTDENIRREKLVERAKKLNQDYADQNPEYGKSWEKLSGFYKESNISASDFIEVLSFLIRCREERELAELEHIRWCRFYYLNYWKYSEQRDNKKRLHNDLKPFELLSEAEQKKDYISVESARSL